MDEELKEKIKDIPDYVKGCSMATINIWRRWNSVAWKIDNFPNRFYDISNPVTGAVKTMDCKGATGLVLKWAAAFGATEDEKSDLKRICGEIQLLKTQKQILCKQWSTEVYGKKRGEKTMLDLRSNEVIELYAKYYSTEEITQIIGDKWGLAINSQVVRKFYVDNKEKIDKLRAEYVLSSKDTRIATDAGRMEILAKLAWEMERKFEKSQSIEVSKELRAIVEQVRKEVKGEEIRLTVDGRIDINATIQANLTVHESLQKLPINMIVIGLTAAKQGLNPAAIIASLSNSYYAKFNGFNKLLDKGEIQLPGAYIKAYNWDEIGEKNKQQTVDIEHIEVYEDSVTDREKVEAKVTKQKMIDMLENYKRQL